MSDAAKVHEYRFKLSIGALLCAVLFGCLGYLSFSQGFGLTENQNEITFSGTTIIFGSVGAWFLIMVPCCIWAAVKFMPLAPKNN